MNKTEKLIAVLLGLATAGWMWYSISSQKKAAEAAAQYAAAHPEVLRSAAPVSPKPPVEAAKETAPQTAAPAVPQKPKAPEKLETLANGEVELTLSTRGAVVKAAKMLKYAQNPGPL